MITYLAHNKINKAKWDECIKNAANGLIYAYSHYLDMVCPDWDALVEDDYKSLMPLPHKIKYGLPYIYPPPFTQQLGVFSTSEITEETVNTFLEAIPKHFRYVEMNMNTFNPINTHAYNTSQLTTYLLDLNPPYEHLYTNYSTQTKRNLKKAMLSQLTVAADVPPHEIISLFRLNRGRQYKHSEAYYDTLHTLIDACIKNKSGQCMGVYTKDKELCAGAFLVTSRKRIIFLFSGVSKTGYNLQAMTFLLDHFIKTNTLQNGIFDFEGSMNPTLARFYKGFGSKEFYYTQIRKNTLPFPAKWIKALQLKKRGAVK